MAEEQKVEREAGTGQFVSKEYAAEHPDTTVQDTIKWYTKDDLVKAMDQAIEANPNANSLDDHLVPFAKFLGLNVREDQEETTD